MNVSRLLYSTCTCKLQREPFAMFYKKGDLKNFLKFTEKHLHHILLFNKFVATSSKKRLWFRCFSANFEKFLRALFLQTASECTVRMKIPAKIFCNFSLKLWMQFCPCRKRTGVCTSGHSVQMSDEWDNAKIS